MQSLTQSSEILPGVFLGNSGDVPIWSSHEASSDVFEWRANNPKGYDLVVECLERGSGTLVPNAQHLKRAEEHLSSLQSLWATGFHQGLPPSRPPPNAHSILHLPFPCSPSASTHAFSDLLSFISFLQSLLHPQGSRRAKILIYSHDGYTESSVLALALVMAEKKCTLPEAYLELQVRRWRSFFVHQGDLLVLKKVEERYHGGNQQQDRFGSFGKASLGRSKERGDRERSGWPWNGFGKHLHHSPSEANLKDSSSGGLSIKFGRRSNGSTTVTTSAPHSPALYDNATWLNHAKFDGSLPSRVLPFLYLGNLNHAVNAHMLHALGITHVVSVGECAILPPEDYSSPTVGSTTNKTHGYGSLWLEEREGRIKVLDIKNMSDDGVDSLLPQLGNICDWIEKARVDGGQVLVHCRVGVSRSATVTIAYLMKHLQLPLVDAYLIVRSRRLSVLIQPNMRLLFNLLAWEVQIARERSHLAGGIEVPMSDSHAQGVLLSQQEDAAARSLARSMTWPFLAREVHRLNAKYIR